MVFAEDRGVLKITKGPIWITNQDSATIVKLVNCIIDVKNVAFYDIGILIKMTIS